MISRLPYVPRIFSENPALGIACFEVKIVDLEGRVVEKRKEGHLNNASHSQLYPGMMHATDLIHRAQRLHELTRTVHVNNIHDVKPTEEGRTAVARSKRT